MMKVTTEQSRPYVFGAFRSVHLPLMEQLGRLEEEVSQTNLNVLFFGETGTGKELLVRAVHQNSSRCHGNFIPTNCAMLCKGDSIDGRDLPPAHQEVNDTQTSLAALMAPPTAALEREMILGALRENDWHRERTAEALGINRRTLYRKMLKYRITILS